MLFKKTGNGLYVPNTGSYIGASRDSNQLSTWDVNNNSADTEILGEKDVLDSRTKDVVRNDGYISGAIETIKSGIVGSEYLLNSKPLIAPLRTLSKSFDDEWRKEFTEEAESQFKIWASSTNNYPDAKRQSNFSDLIRLAVGLSIQTGEVLSTAEAQTTLGTSFLTCINFIDTDRLFSPSGLDDVTGGIKTGVFGEPRKYYISKKHPCEYGYSDPDESQFFKIKAFSPSGRRNVIHLFQPYRASQSRAVSKMTSVLKEIKMTKKFKDTLLENAIMNATFAATIESELPTKQTFGQLGAETVDDSVDYMTKVSEFSKHNGLKLKGAQVTHLWPGQKLELRNASDGSGNYELEQSLLRHMASAFSLSHEEFTRDFTKTNFASAMAAMSMTARQLKMTKSIIADKFATIIYQLWLDEAVVKKLVPMPFNVSSKQFNSTLLKDCLSSCSWIGASSAQVNPKNEVEAAVKRIEANLSTHEKEAAVFGNDFREVFAQRAREKEIMAELGINENE